MKTEFTKGEWSIKQSPLKTSFVIVPEDSRLNDEFSIAVINGSDKKANAHLIASAPDMYAILEALSNFNCPCEYISESEMAAFDKIESILKSVRGE